MTVTRLVDEYIEWRRHCLLQRGRSRVPDLLKYGWPIVLLEAILHIVLDIEQCPAVQSLEIVPL
jgi:hypothetical protein